MSRKPRPLWIRIGLVSLLIFFPVIAGVAYLYTSASLYRKLFYPREIVILSGPDGGLYQQLATDLKRVIESRLGLSVILPETRGSVDNLIELKAGKAHFALYQPGSMEILTEDHRTIDSGLACVANLYSQPVHLIVRNGAEIDTAADLVGKRVHLGLENSGDYAMSLVLIKHLGLRESDFIVERLTYADLVEHFLNDGLDAAFITLGVQAPMFQELFSSGKCQLLPVPFADALLTRQISLSRYSIPQGLYHSQPPIEPRTDIETVALGAQLITREDVPAALVTEILQLIMDEEFLKRNRLGELYAGGSEFAERKPEFRLHPGAVNYFHAEFDVQVFEGWEALYSLAASLLIAGVLLFRTVRQRTERTKEHRLDQYVRKLLAIERRQLDLDQRQPSNDVENLQQLLDEVTELRQQALQEFTAHELNEDRAVDSFIEMCHALNNKINAKLTRQRFDIAISRVIDAVANPSKADSK